MQADSKAAGPEGAAEGQKDTRERRSAPAAAEGQGAAERVGAPAADTARLLLVRHGQSLSNVGGVFTGQTDVPLSALGEKQAAALCGYLLRTYTIDAVYASDLQRAVATVQSTADALGLPVRRERALREIDGGAWEGEPVSFIAQHYAADYALWREDIGLARCTGGESMRALQARAAAAVGGIAARSLGKTVLIATHAAFLRALLCYWQNVPLEGMKDVPWVPNASVTEVLWRKKEAPVVRPAEYSFLHGQVTRLASGI